MSDEVEKTVTEAVKTASDGTVKIAVERYNELLETIADQKISINDLKNRPPVINRKVVQKTAEMLAQEHRAWGGTLMGLGASFFVIGAFRYKAGKS